MSTRSFIGRPTDLGVAGRYHHFDGSPYWLGRTLGQAYHTFFEQDHERMAAYLIDDHPAGWSSIVDADFSMEPGFTSSMWGNEDHPEWKRPRCYCHGDRHDEGFEWTCTCGARTDDLTHECESWDAEYIYAITRDGIEVWYIDRVTPEGRHIRWGLVRWENSLDDATWVAVENAIRTIQQRPLLSVA